MLLGLTITCLLFPALTVPFSLLGYISKNKVQRVLGLFFLALFMGLMAMCFRDPKTDPDIVRYIAAVKDYANVSFFRAFNHGSYENLYVIDILVLDHCQDGELSVDCRYVSISSLI